MNYLAIVNKALRESGITQDDLTSGTFASPSDPILTRFKYWAADAWQDIQLLKRDWEFMQSTGVTLCNPKLEVYGAYAGVGSTAATFTGEVFKLHNTANADVLSVTSLTLTSSSPASTVIGDAEGELVCSYSAYDVPFLIEPGDMLTNAAGTVFCLFQRHGRYNLSQAIGEFGRNTSTDIAELKLDSLAASDVQFGAGQSYSSVTYTKLKFIPYGDWQRYGYDRPKNVGAPICFTLSNDGRIEFYPPLDTTYNISFEYTRTPQTLSAYGDTPTGLPDRFHDAIVWRSLMYWAEYEGNGQQYGRAEKRYKKLESDMIRDLLPPVRMSYDARQW